MGFFKRDRTGEAPEGWVVTDAVVSASRDSRRGGAASTAISGGGGAGISHRYEISYAFLTQAGELVTAGESERRRVKDQPVPGDRVTIAYDPADPQEWVLVEREAERTWRIVADIQRWLAGGAEAPVEVIAAEPTGRVARMGFGAGDDGAPDETEMRLRLQATPAAGPPFEVEMPYWEKPELVQPGARGMYFYDAAEPQRGIPTFPSSRHDTGVVDPVAAAREEFIAKFAHLEIPKQYR